MGWCAAATTCNGSQRSRSDFRRRGRKEQRSRGSPRRFRGSIACFRVYDFAERVRASGFKMKAATRLKAGKGSAEERRPGGAERLIVPGEGIAELRNAARDCRACDLWKDATQTVFGEGPDHAAIMFVGEQPGDLEDRSGHPFVGPAGKLFDQALADAGIERSDVYVTNVVKHFKWSPAERGKRRIHKKPRYSEIQACRPWLDAELEAVRPKVLVCLGASAAQALLGRDFRVSRDRGKAIESSLAPYVLATVHPSSILRAPDDEARHTQMEAFVEDMRQVARIARGKISNV
jgi:uracil-DNA glycosylase